MTRKRTVLVAGVGLLVAIQLVRFERTNPPVTGEIDAPADVKAVLRRACYDCHSNETVWPWYSQVAPPSWLLHRDVVVGRKHLNFSEWASLPADKQAKKLREIKKEVASGDMPMPIYLPLHPSAKLTPADAKLVTDWAEGGGSR